MKRLVAAALAAVSCGAAAADPAPAPAAAPQQPQTRQLRLLQGGMPAFPTQMIQGGACVTV